jgi:glycosyltransferase involved in cell wall biosynthesis
MRVAIDARPAVSSGKTGVGHYTWHLVHQLPRVDRGTTYVAWYLHVRRLVGHPSALGDLREPNLVDRWTPLPSRVWAALESRFGVPKIDWFARFDVLFAPNFVPPPTDAGALVVTVHDLAFRLFPETAPHATQRWRRAVEASLRRAAGVVVPSDSTKRDLVEHYPVHPERVTVAHLGVDAAAFRDPSPADVAAVAARFRIDRPYILFLGGLESRKNLVRIVEAFARTPIDLDLVIAGGAVPWDPGAAGALREALAGLDAGVRRRVILTGYVSQRQKAALLAGSRSLVYPSLYEGFGLPVVEALAAGVPVLTSEVSSLPEVAGDAALLVDPRDVEAIADGMRRLVEDETLRRRLAEAGPRRAAKFTWKDTAARTAAAIRRAAENAKRPRSPNPPC